MRHIASTKKDFMRKLISMFVFLLFATSSTIAQQVYEDFDGNSVQTLGPVNGVIDIKAKNPAPNKVNSSAECGKYTRPKGVPYANIKMDLKAKLTDVSTYATYLGVPPKLKLKVYTKAPKGTRVEIQLGRKGDTYPTGIHSIYQVNTTVQNAWEELSFNFSEIPKGSTTSATEVDEVIIMFSPNTSNNDVFYLDDVTGPSMASAPVSADKPTLTK